MIPFKMFLLDAEFYFMHKQETKPNREWFGI